MSILGERQKIAERKLARVNLGEKLPRVDPFATAFHEAAHAVFDEGFGITVKSLTCFPSVDEHGSLFGSVDSNADQVALPASVQIVRTFAGDVAEHKLIYNTPQSWDSFKISSSDFGNIGTYLKHLKIQDPVVAKEFLSELFDNTVNLVEKSYKWIRSIAIELYAHKNLSGDALREVLRTEKFYDNNPFTEYLEYCVAMNRYQSAMQSMRNAGVSEQQLLEMRERLATYIESRSPEEKQQFMLWCRQQSEKIPLRLAA